MKLLLISHETRLGGHCHLAIQLSLEVEHCGDGCVVGPALGVGGGAFDVGFNAPVGEAFLTNN
ncbi:hypothetical protein ACFU7Y_28815 [Kitasatospora sp. NPDC057542]|uniref:hypothetical protein n=1 Tax=Kitasatospora sp. NPDC057542 TaxID=3346162 RepID=UPI0036A9DC13